MDIQDKQEWKEFFLILFILSTHVNKEFTI